MSTTQFNFKTLVQRCGMKDYDVRYRVNQLKLGKQITPNFFLYSDKDVEKIINYGKQK